MELKDRQCIEEREDREEKEREGMFSWIKTGFGHCPVEQANVFTFLLLWVDLDSKTFPGHLLLTPTFESQANKKAYFTPKISRCWALIGCPGQGPEKRGWALRIFRKIFSPVLASANICFQSKLVMVKWLPLSLSLFLSVEDSKGRERERELNHTLN